MSKQAHLILLHCGRHTAVCIHITEVHLATRLQHSVCLCRTMLQLRVGLKGALHTSLSGTWG